MAWKLIPSEAAEYCASVAIAKGYDPRGFTLRDALRVARVDRNILTLREWSHIDG